MVLQKVKNNMKKDKMPKEAVPDDNDSLILDDIKDFLNIDDDDENIKISYKNVGNNKYRVNIYKSYYAENSIRLSKIIKSYYLCNENGLKDITK